MGSLFFFLVTLMLTFRRTPKSKLLLELSKQFHLQLARPSKPTRGESVLDFILHGSALHVNCDHVLPTLTDHNAILWSISLDIPSQKRVLRIPNKTFANRISLQALKEPTAKCSLDVLNIFKRLRNKNKRKWFKLIKPRPKTFPFLDFLLNVKEDEDFIKESRLYWKNLWEEVEDKRFSPHSKGGFLSLQKYFQRSYV